MRLALIIIISAFAALSLAQITPVGGPTPVNSSSYPITLSYSPTAGNAFISSTSVNFNGTYTYGHEYNSSSLPVNTEFPGPEATDGTISLLMFYTFAASGATSEVYSGFTPASATSVLAEELSGVSSFNPSLTASSSASGVTAPCALGSSATSCATGTVNSYKVTPDDSTDTMLTTCGGHGSGSWSSLTGTLLKTESSNPSSVLFYQNTTGTTPVTVGGTFSASGSVCATVELRPVAYSPAFPMVEIETTGYPALGGSGCASSGTYCSLILVPTKAGDGLYVTATDDVDNGNGTTISITGASTCNVSASSCTASANACSSGVIDTLSTFTTGNGSGKCNTSGYAGSGSYTNSAMGARIDSGAGGANCITVTKSGAVSGEKWAFTNYETIPGGSLDSSYAQGDNVGEAVHTISGTSISGSNRLVVQAFAGNANQTPSPPYFMGPCFSHYCGFFALNQSSQVSNVVTGSASNEPAGACTIAIKPAGGGGGSAHCAACDMSFVDREIFSIP